MVIAQKVYITMSWWSDNTTKEVQFPSSWSYKTLVHGYASVLMNLVINHLHANCLLWLENKNGSNMSLIRMFSRKILKSNKKLIMISRNSDCLMCNKLHYQSALILTELFQHNLIKRFLSHGMLPLSGHDNDNDVDMHHDYFQKKMFWPFDHTPGAEGVCEMVRWIFRASFSPVNII